MYLTLLAAIMSQVTGECTENTDSCRRTMILKICTVVAKKTFPYCKRNTIVRFRHKRTLLCLSKTSYGRMNALYNCNHTAVFAAGRREQRVKNKPR